MSWYVACLLMVVAVVISGCSTVKVRPMDAQSDTTLNSPLNFPLSYSSEVTIELVSINGAEAPRNSINAAIERFIRHVPGRIKLNTGLNISIQTDSLGKLPQESIEEAMQKAALRTETIGPATIVILIASDIQGIRELSTYKPAIITRSDGTKVGTNQIVLISGNIDYYGKHIRYLNTKQAWEYATYRELCRSLGLPHRSNHIYANGQCTHADCILHPTFAKEHGGYSTKVLRPAADLCNDCMAEAYFLIRTHPKPLLDPKRELPSIEWYDRLVEANPSHPSALLMRHDVLVKTKQYKRALSDIAEAYANSFEDAMITNIYVKYLVNCPDESLRDTTKALGLALKLNQMTSFQDADFLQTLANVYEVRGDTKHALEYYKKAKAIKSTVHRKRDRSPAFYNPYRN